MNGGLLRHQMISHYGSQDSQSCAISSFDLGGHTADNHPVLLSHRLAAVQATYLGFYGPTYASCCDWWIVDHAFNVGFLAHIPGLRSFGLCQVPVFAMSLSYMVCLMLRISTIKNPIILFLAVLITRAKSLGLLNSDLVRCFRPILMLCSSSAAIPFRIPAVRRYFLQRLSRYGHCSSSTSTFALRSFFCSCHG